MRLAPLVLFAACQSPSAPPHAPQSPPERREPTRFEVYSLLFQSGRVPLSEGAHCDGVVGATLQRPATLADWIAWNLSVLEEGEIHLPTRCAAVEGADLQWECTVEFQALGGEDPWNWGVRFRMRNADRRLVARSLLCTGAG